MTWIIQLLPLLVFVFIAVSIGRAINRARQQSMEHDASANDSEEQRRIREIQARIRRLAAERRGEREPDAPPPLAPMVEPPAARRASPPEEAPPGPFAGPLRRVMEELERRAEPVRRPPPLVDIRPAELERQQRLAEEMRVLEESRALAQRRATKLAEAVVTQAATEAGQLTSSRQKLLGDLADRQSLRRAFVLREVLGPPVGLR